MAEGGAVARDARAHGFGNRGKGHGKARDAAVGLNHLDIQIAVVGGAIEVVDDEGTGSDGGFVDLLAVLADDHPCVAVRCTAYLWSIAALRVCQHAVVAGQAHAAITQAAEQIALGEALAQGQFAAQAWHRALGIGADAVPVAAGVSRIAGVAVVGLVAQAPQAEIDAPAQPQVAIVRVAVAAYSVEARAIEAGVVVDEAHATASVPLVGTHVAAWLDIQQGLGHREIEAQKGGVEIEGRAWQAFFQPQAISRRLHAGLRGGADAQRPAQEAAGPGAELDPGATGVAAVEIDIDMVGSGVHLVGPVEAF